ncbi:hypothetical protein OH77DRAFT_133395 [Trametes cingulata]|nr:hypothetical protein OH77DRAFT_133395 [Trametes cingulata]
MQCDADQDLPLAHRLRSRTLERFVWTNTLGNHSSRSAVRTPFVHPPTFRSSSSPQPSFSGHPQHHALAADSSSRTAPRVVYRVALLRPNDKAEAGQRVRVVRPSVLLSPPWHRWATRRACPSGNRGARERGGTIEPWAVDRFCDLCGPATFHDPIRAGGLPLRRGQAEEVGASVLHLGRVDCSCAERGRGTRVAVWRSDGRWFSQTPSLRVAKYARSSPFRRLGIAQVDANAGAA